MNKTISKEELYDLIEIKNIDIDDYIEIKKVLDEFLRELKDQSVKNSIAKHTYITNITKKGNLAGR